MEFADLSAYVVSQLIPFILFIFSLLSVLVILTNHMLDLYCTCLSLNAASSVVLDDWFHSLLWGSVCQDLAGLPCLYQPQASETCKHLYVGYDRLGTYHSPKLQKHVRTCMQAAIG